MSGLNNLNNEAGGSPLGQPRHQENPDAPPPAASQEGWHEPDNFGLEARCGIGFVDIVNGPGSRECADFHPSFFELRILADFWAREHLDQQLFYFLYGQTGSTEWRTMIYAERRLSRLAAILGREVEDEVLAKAERELKALYKLSDEDWAIFERGDSDEYHAFRTSLCNEEVDFEEVDNSDEYDDYCASPGDEESTWEEEVDDPADDV